jgi:hypothetical protein
LRFRFRGRREAFCRFDVLVVAIVVVCSASALV